MEPTTDDAPETVRSPVARAAKDYDVETLAAALALRLRTSGREVPAAVAALAAGR